jgi:two-component system, LytTR family, response regulator
MNFTNLGDWSNQNMLRTIIIDDEAPVREMLTKLLAKFCPQAQLVGEAFSVASGLKAIRELHPGLVLLDIKMEDGTGFDMLSQLESINFKIIFITAYEKYAVQAFKFAAIDFILKPVNPEELADAVIRAETLSQYQFNTQLQALEENLKTDIREKKKIVFKTQGDIFLFDLQDIIFLESDGCYTLVYTKEENKIMVSKTLKDYDELLSGNGFYRVHKSFLINLVHVKRFERKEGGTLILTGDHKIPVASRKREELLQMFYKLAL